jgi:hypothetical protein
MKYRTLMMLLGVLVTLSACVVEPFNGGYGGGRESGGRGYGGRDEERGNNDYGRHVWRQ